MSKQYWKSCRVQEPSRELVELLNGMLQEDPERRYGVKEILESKWMKSGEVPDEELHAFSVELLAHSSEYIPEF
jgi:serine/threonine protein kinase